MEVIKITDDHKKFVGEYAIKQTIGGRTNLQTNDLAKASREHFQYTGLYGELAWHLFRYGNLDKLKSTLDYKYDYCRTNKVGDGGYDDHLTVGEVTRIIDVKSSHRPVNDIERLNLIIPKNEYHENTIYVAAFSIGPSRVDVNEVILAGWANNERVTKIWRQDEPDKRCVPVTELRNLSALKKLFV